MPILLAFLLLLGSGLLQGAGFAEASDSSSPAAMGSTVPPPVHHYGGIPPEAIALLVAPEQDPLASLQHLDTLPWRAVNKGDIRNTSEERWLRFTLRVPAGPVPPLVLQLNNAYTRGATLYVVHQAQLIQQTPFGNDVPIAERPIQTPFPIIPLEITAAGDYTLLIRAYDRYLLRMVRGLSILPERELAFVYRPLQMSLGSAFVGLIFTFLIFTVALLLWRFRQEYAYAAVFLVGAWWTILLREGLLFQLTGWFGEWWEYGAVTAAMGCTLAGALLYLRERLKPFPRLLDYYLQGSGWVFLLLSLLALFINMYIYSSMLGIVYVNAVLALLVLVAYAGWQAVRGGVRQCIFVVVWVVFIANAVGRLLLGVFVDSPIGSRMYWNVSLTLASAWIFCEYLLEVTRDELERSRLQTAASSRIELVNRLSHEIRTPLNAVIGLADLLRVQRDPDVTHNYAGMIHSAGQTLLHLVNDILDFSKLREHSTRLMHEPFRLDRAMTDVLSGFLPQLRETGINPHTRIDIGLPYYVLGDATRFKQIFTNLIGNAIKFSSAEGLIEISLRCGESRDGQVQLLGEVRDHGRGIPADKLEAVFEPYVQTEASDSSRLQGTGLGLAITRLLVQQMGGSISASSAPGQGATFHFDLWLTVDPHGPDLPVLLAPLRDRRVALITQLPEVLASLADSMTRFGVIVSRYASLEEFRRAGSPVDLVLTETIRTLTQAQADTLAQLLVDTQVVVMESETCDWLNIDSLSRLSHIRLPMPSLSILARLASLLGNAPVVLPDEQAAAPELPETLHRVLLVDDNMVNLTVCGKLLDSLNTPHVQAQGGQLAVDSFTSELFSLVLLDCEMPGMDGYAVARAMRAFERKHGRAPVPIVALTAHALDEVRVRCLAAGMSEVMHKPVTRQALALLLARYKGCESVGGGEGSAISGVTQQGVDTAGSR